MNDRKLESLRMLMDWQLKQLGHDPKEINRLLQELDDRKAGHVAAQAHLRTSRYAAPRQFN